MNYTNRILERRLGSGHRKGNMNLLALDYRERLQRHALQQRRLSGLGKT